MSVSALYDETLERLWRGDEVGVAETLKSEAAANVELLEQQITAEREGETDTTAEERVQSFLTAHDDVNERLLAAVFVRGTACRRMYTFFAVAGTFGAPGIEPRIRPGRL